MNELLFPGQSLNYQPSAGLQQYQYTNLNDQNSLKKQYQQAISGGPMSLGGPGYQSYMTPSKPSYAPGAMASNFSNSLTSQDQVRQALQQANSKNYDKDLKRTDNDSSNLNDFTDAQKKMGAQKEAWGGTSYDWNKMGGEGQMGVINAGFTMAGLIGNFFH